ncbi:mitochondrial ribosome-associated GTPase 2 [Hyperolius riggenbachi]|uniref:mitochondrial ribosome-associated GTPase 2 n=1 Tax=Hyperolius riggenbachi TaxID=752182 RepID=UPI0035A308E9
MEHKSCGQEVMSALQLLAQLRVLGNQVRSCQSAARRCVFSLSLVPLTLHQRPVSTGHLLYGKPRNLIKRKKELSEKKLTRFFVDHRKIRVVGGAGGNGACCFHSEPRKEFGGPDGGDGGNGGHVILKVDPSVKSLSSILPLYQGISGKPGRSKNCYGRGGENVYIKVPIGTVVKENGVILLEMKAAGEEFVAAYGGTGGKGNRFFLSNENRAPMMTMPGELGEEKILQLEMKTMAHAGMVGFPNAGKSSLLRLLTNARPAVAAYPFTTLNPHVGVINYQDYEQVAVADIPGIIDGAHLNRGLGFSFLRHIERCRFFLYVLDLEHPKPWTQFRALQYELSQFDEDLSKRPHVIVANKIDLPCAEKTLESLRREVDSKVIAVSALTGENAEELILQIREMYDGQRTVRKKTESYTGW